MNKRTHYGHGNRQSPRKTPFRSICDHCGNLGAYQTKGQMAHAVEICVRRARTEARACARVAVLQYHPHTEAALWWFLGRALVLRQVGTRDKQR